LGDELKNEFFYQFVIDEASSKWHREMGRWNENSCITIFYPLFKSNQYSKKDIYVVPSY